MNERGRFYTKTGLHLRAVLVLNQSPLWTPLNITNPSRPALTARAQLHAQVHARLRSNLGR
jgi:hypothetical protein